MYLRLLYNFDCLPSRRRIEANSFRLGGKMSDRLVLALGACHITVRMTTCTMCILLAQARLKLDSSKNWPVSSVQAFSDAASAG